MTELNHSVYSIYKWLLSRHIKVPLEWVQECVSFLVSEGISQELMCDSVYEQWLVSDVKTLQEGVINFNTDIKELKNEVFALQMNYAIDISKSRFSQLRALLGVNDGNTDVQAFEDPNTKWEPKPSRCLLLELTDGVQQVKGIEVEPLCELSTALECGTKLLIKGPIKCVRGCLLLRKNCISILGGHVDELVERYSQPSVLKSLLDNVAANQNRELCSKSFPNAGKIKGAKADIKPKILTDIKQAPSQAARNLEPVTAAARRNANVMPSSMAIEWDDEMSEDEFIAETKFEPKVSSPVTKGRTGTISELPADTKPGYTKPSPAPPMSMEVFQSADEVNWSDDDFDSHGQNMAGANPISSRAPNLSFSQIAGRTLL
ncbi:RMI1 [Bugula neritina]|uniref:RecQ-mediated genome instability protein 1 n=1 Tax=Bugula neritina TaxID=10212 RepID=A0A7J7K7W7_BUGNE|nr:RMI1 [Bugula neritina]